MSRKENIIDIVYDSEPPALTSTESYREEKTALESDIAGEHGNRWHGLVVNLAQETTLR